MPDDVSQPGASPAGPVTPSNEKASAPASQPAHPQHHHQAHAHQAKPHYTAARFPAAELIATLADGTKIKRRVSRMRACDEKDEKGELCTGHLKRWFDYGQEIRDRHGDEIYRCERCHTLYLPNLEEKPRSGTLSW